MCCIISKRFYLQRKAFDLLNKMCYILGVVALLAACDVTNNSHYLGRYLATSRPRAFLGFYQELEIGLIRQEMVIFCA